MEAPRQHITTRQKLVASTCHPTGLSDESKEGKWQWFTLEESTRFSNWKQDEPDNEGRTGSDYAVMDVAKAG